MEVLSKEIGILTPFGPMHLFLGTFVLYKETGSKWDYGGEFNNFLEMSKNSKTVVWKDGRI